MTNEIEPQRVEVEVLPPDDGPQPVTRIPRIPRKKKALLHPWTAGLILGLDWFLFSGTFLSGYSLIFVIMPLGFASALIATTLIQRKLTGDSGATALLKGLAAGLLVGAPFPIGGTIVGGAILAMAGLDSLRGLLTHSREEE